MIRIITAIAIMGLSLVAVSAQVNSAVASSPAKDLLTKGTPANSRERIVSRNEQTDHNGDQRPEVSSASTQLSADVKRAISAFNHVQSESPNNAFLTTLSRTNAPPVTIVHAPVAALTQEYRVGVGDVLDVQLADLPTRKSSLFTVREGGTLDYPLAGEAVVVAGLTADEIATRLRARIKVLENPKVIVRVRDYASHNVIITGWVADPGAKFLRREALPLYVVLVEAQPRPEASSATITRSGQPVINVDLADHKSMSTLVIAGDLIKIAGPASESAGFFYAGGALNQPGQKSFHAGLTLTQAILASGGVTRVAGSKAKVTRQVADGRLTTTEYNLRLIEDGEAADPIIERGDRITVSQNR